MRFLIKVFVYFLESWLTGVRRRMTWLWRDKGPSDWSTVI